MDSVRNVDLTIEKRLQVSRMEIVDSGRRRRFSNEAKLAIVAESYSAPRQVTATARRHGITRFQLNVGVKQLARDGSAMVGGVKGLFLHCWTRNQACRLLRRPILRRHKVGLWRLSAPMVAV